MKRVMLGLLGLACGAALQLPVLAVTDPADLDAAWAKIDKPGDNLGPRLLIAFCLSAAAEKWHPERVDQALTLLDGMQDHDESSASYGNFRWYKWQNKPVDLNAVEFTMEQAILLWNLYRDNLDQAGQDQLQKIIQLGIEGIKRHTVNIDYTNMFLTKTWNSIAIGEAFHNDDLAAGGYAMLETWMAHVGTTGIYEYQSPIYSGIDINCLALINKYASRPQERDAAQIALQYIYWQCRATWFEPDLRLGGTHSRDYDYTTGHGQDLEYHLAEWGWLPAFKPTALQEMQEYWDLTNWKPTDTTSLNDDLTVPRFVWMKWGSDPSQYATLYLGKTLSIGASGGGNGPEDKIFVINFDGGPAMAMGNFFMDGRGDDYGHDLIKTVQGHAKAHHLSPFVASAQDGTDVLFFCSYGGPKETKPYADPPATCLTSDLDLPAEVAVWQNNQEVVATGTQGVTLAPDQPIFLRYKNSVVALNILQATNDSGNPISPVFFRDGDPFHSCRISWAHAVGAPQREAHVLFWARAAEDVDDASFGKFRDDFARAKGEAHEDEGKLEAQVEAKSGPLTLTVDLSSGAKTTSMAARTGIFEINGKEVGKTLLGAPVATSP